MLGFALLTVVGLADFLTGTEISFSIFYVAPIAVVAWFSGRGAGWAFAVLSDGALGGSRPAWPPCAMEIPFRSSTWTSTTSNG